MLALVFYVAFVDEPSGHHTEPPDILKLRINPHDRGRKRLLPKTQGIGEVKASISPVYLLAELFRESDVPVIETDQRVFLYSVIGFAGGSGIDGDYILDGVHGVVHQRIHKAVASTQKHYDDDDSPAYRKTGKGGAQLVLPQGAPYFRKKIQHGIRLFEHSFASKPYGIVGTVFFNLADDSVLDVDYPVGVICNTAFVGNDYYGEFFLFVEFLEKVHDFD